MFCRGTRHGASRHDMFSVEHVMAQAPGYDKLMGWADTPIMPTPGAVGHIMQVIAKQKGISTKEAVELLANISDSQHEEDIYEFAEELEELNRDQVGGVETQIDFVTLFMQYRAEAQINGKKKWEKLSDWSVEDTEAMPTQVLQDIFQLIIWERDGWPKEGNDEAEAVAS